MGDENKEFRVVDRRASSSSDEEKKTATPSQSASGEGFVMKDAPKKEEEPFAPGKLDFSTLIFSLATGALINMGLAPDPVTKKTQKNLELARQNIDILSMLKEKTKGNLTEEEDKLFENLLTEVRLRFVEASR